MYIEISMADARLYQNRSKATECVERFLATDFDVRRVCLQKL